MSEPNITRAITVERIGGSLTEDGRHALLKIVRANPTPASGTEFHLAIPTGMLPTVAAVCLSLTEPVQDAAHGKVNRAVVSAEMVEGGIVNDGQIVLTYELASKATISFGLDSNQARILIDGLSALVGHTPTDQTPGKGRH